ncbi:MAG: arylsulfatase [Cyclobacteriaceae bacterium]
MNTNQRPLFSLIAGLIIIINFVSCQQSKTDKIDPNPKPNVIFVMTDDQGMGDIACHGNPWIKTPNLDKFYGESVRMTDFHVSPMCTPTRAAIMTGQYPINNGVWATYKGRDMLHPNSVLMSDVFKQNGYTTGIFGKWHLGDNYPSRPTDRGFDYAVHHKAGGVGELSDYWGNNYFDDTYYVNNEPKPFKGYCTDVWFDETIKFIKRNKEKPIFIYLPTNAPHGPLYVDKKYSDPYEHLESEKIVSAEFYGMIENIDENFGKLDRALNEMGLAENTILIFCTDNGSHYGISSDYKLGWSRGFRGRKGQKLETGHRVPFFVRWPKAGISGGKDVPDLTSHVDLIPTLAGLCDMNLPDTFDGDGVDFSPILLGEKEKLDERTVFVHHNQNTPPPHPTDKTAIMRGDWRLLNGTELYNIKEDKKELTDVSDQHPEIVEQLLADNEKFIARAKARMEYQELPYNHVGSDAQKRIKLTIQHAMGKSGGIWKPEQVAGGLKSSNATQAVQFLKKGKYRISCMRWPEECPGKILGVPEVNPKNQYEYQSISPEKAVISLDGKTYEQAISVDDVSVDFDLELEAGKVLLDSHFVEGEEKYGVYYTYIEFLGS